ncbi:MAG: hypothetical protein M1838_000343 [Thelocarpon superellum]|nr:MAG: hypothetical protein M1838_000343 [Thelocarpon superellum]
MASVGKKKASQKTGRKSATLAHRTSGGPRKTEILINVYDLLPPGRLSTILWTVGTSLLHSGVVINDREYAYGGHDHQGVSGVYWTKPRTEPPGGSFRCEILHGFTMRSDDEIADIIHEVSEEFLGPSYNLLSKNCNHFTHALCQKMTSRPAPGWLNRAAGIGVALPCVVPREWIAPPDHDTADGELLEEDEYDERSSMLRDVHMTRRSVDEPAEGVSATSQPSDGSSGEHGPDKGKGATRDTSGRTMPASERAPPLHHREETA